jgi:hypothetical protein
METAPMPDTQRFGPVVAALVAERRLNPLGPGSPDLDRQAQLEALRLETAFAPYAVRDEHMAMACLAGLWLYYNFLEESHQVSQDIPTPTGSYWHGLMHRREPDFGNAAYWFRQVGRHPVFEPLRAAAAQVAAAADLEPAARFLVEQAQWDPFAFVNLCEHVLEGQSQSEALCREIQLREWETLFEHCYRGAVGMTG